MAVVMYGKKCGFGNEEGSIRLVSCLNKIFRKGKCLPRPCGWFSTARGDGRSVESSKKFDKIPEKPENKGKTGPGRSSKRFDFF